MKGTTHKAIAKKEHSLLYKGCPGSPGKFGRLRNTHQASTLNPPDNRITSGSDDSTVHLDIGGQCEVSKAG